MPIYPPEVLAQKMIQKYAQNTEGKGSVLVQELTRAIESGIIPTKEAAKRYEKMKRKLIDFLNSDLWPKIMESIDPELYKKIVQEVSASAYDNAVRAKRIKQEIFARSWAPLLVKHIAKIQSMPDVTDADRERRMIENLRGLKKLKGAWRKLPS